MVLLHVKRGEESLFLYEAPADSELASLIPQLTKLQNLRSRFIRLKMALEDLCQFGPAKHPSEQAVVDSMVGSEQADQDPAGKEAVVEGRSVMIRPDPTGRRTGHAPMPNQVETIERTMEDAMRVMSKDRVTRNERLTMEEMEEALKLVRASVTMAYPMGLPAYDPVQEILDDKEELEGTSAGKDYLDPDTTSLWWASKELVRGKWLRDFVGKNDKTKIVAKLQKKGAGPPVREPMVDEQTQKQMMAYYYKKQEENKRLMENADDDYLNSSWADPRRLKNYFNGVSDVSWKPR